MENEMQKEGEAERALPVDGTHGPANASGYAAGKGDSASMDLPTPAEGQKRPYSPPRVRSLGKVSELTFGNTQGSKSDGLRRRNG
jgi:hypothetical protein